MFGIFKLYMLHVNCRKHCFVNQRVSIIVIVAVIKSRLAAKFSPPFNTTTRALFLRRIQQLSQCYFHTGVLLDGKSVHFDVVVACFMLRTSEGNANYVLFIIYSAVA